MTSPVVLHGLCAMISFARSGSPPMIKHLTSVGNVGKTGKVGSAGNVGDAGIM